jgi:hypothetical protein
MLSTVMLAVQKSSFSEKLFVDYPARLIRSERPSAHGFVVPEKRLRIKGLRRAGGAYSDATIMTDYERI